MARIPDQDVEMAVRTANEVQGTTSGIVVATSAASVIARKNGTNIGTRPVLNFIDGTNFLFTVADDGVGNEIEITGSVTGVFPPKANYAATAAPTVNDDSGDGYSVGSIWCDVTADDAYIALDVGVGAAVWKKITP